MHKSARIYGLDILRAVAILLVIYGHGLAYLISQNASLFGLGDGVSIFFVLSGYLIGSILFKTINKKFEFKDLLNFWKRRWLRTLPAYYFVLTILMIYTHRLEIGYYFFFQNWFSGDLKFYGESWSLSVEEWFYLLVPIIFFISLKAFDRKYLLVPILLIIIYGIVYHILKATPDMGDNYRYILRFSVASRIDSIMWGILAAYISFYNIKLWRKLKTLFPLGIILWVLLIVQSNFFKSNPSYAWIVMLLESFSVFCLIPYLSSVKTGKGIIYKFLSFISTISYSMYLLNLAPASTIIKYHGIRTYTQSYPLLAFSMFIIITFGGGYLLYKFIEKPFMNLRDRITFERKRPKLNYQTAEIKGE